MDVTKRIYPALPHWVASLYAVLGVLTVPWIIYLGLTLPTRHISRNWDVSWVGLDITIVFFLLLNALFSYRESKWLVMSATATATLLVTDAWFDITSEHAGRPLQEAIALAAFVELPLALLTFSVALRIVQREHTRNPALRRRRYAKRR
jgi:hypothetical protein